MSQDAASALRAALHLAVDGRAVPAPVMEAAVEAILSGEAPEALVSGFAVALRMKGESAEEIAAAARVLRRRCAPVELQLEAGRPLLDTCGTGGDGADTFNISTVSAFVVAACGVPVAKHGNRAVSSRCGSADLLEALGVNLNASPATVSRCIAEAGIGFLFAPAHHGALRHAAPVRRALALRTVFNLLGPLANPAGATHQLIGVFDPARIVPLAEVLGLLGTQAAWVVHGDGGLDEISPSGPTQVAVLADGRVTRRAVEPADFGMSAVALSTLVGGDARRNAEIAREVLSGATGGPRTAVVINAAAALVVAGSVADLDAAARRAGEAIDSGAARGCLDAMVALSKNN